MASSKDADTHQTKLHSICKIGEFERQRLKYFTPQIKANSTHWEAFKTTLAKSNTENERVLSFFNKRIEIEERYCQHLAELPYTDLKGTGAWRKGGTTTSSFSSTFSSTTTVKTTSTTKTATEATFTPTNPTSSLPAMDAMMASTDTLVLKYTDYVRDTRKELLEGKLKSLVTAFNNTSDEILLEGNHALDNVKIAEQHIFSAYLDYYKAYQALPLPQQQQQQQQQQQKQNPGEGEAGAGAVAADMWLLDTQYRVAVELQKTIWQSTQQHLHDLFRRMKTLEVNRRSQVHALILRYMQNQGSFWAQLPQAAADCSVAISGLSSTDPNQVESELGEEIRECAKAVEARELQQQQQQQCHATGRRKSSISSPPMGGGSERGNPINMTTTTTTMTTTTTTALSSLSVEPFTGHLLAPLDTPLVRRVEILERRLVTGVESLPFLKRWRPCLAVLTLDGFLHLFDLPPEIAPGTVLTPREAFKLLIPSPIDRKGRFKKGKDVERVFPSLTFAFPFSSARFRAEEGPEAFEIIEARQNTGFVSMFKAREVKRVVLKARTQEKMVDWVVTVNNEMEKKYKDEPKDCTAAAVARTTTTVATTAVSPAPVAVAPVEAVEGPVVASTERKEEEEEEQDEEEEEEKKKKIAPASAVLAPLLACEKEGRKEEEKETAAPSLPPPPSQAREKEEKKEDGGEGETPPLPLLVEQSKSTTVPESSSSSISSSNNNNSSSNIS